LAQNAFKPHFSIGINSGFLEHPGQTLQGFLNYKPSLSIPVSAGFEYTKDTFLLLIDVRHSKQKAIFQRDPSPFDEPDILFFTKSLSLQVCPGLHLNERSKIYLVTGLSLPYASEAGSSSSVNGTNYYIQAVNNTNQPAYLNLGLSLYLKLFLKRSIGLVLSAETSSLANKTSITIVNSTDPPETHDIYYKQFFFFAMIRVN
jgi:hypothetical protein